MPHKDKPDKLSAKRQKVRYSAGLRVDEVCAHLDALARALRDGTVDLTHGDESLSIPVTESLRFEVKADLSPKKTSIAIEMAWGKAFDDSPRAPLSIESHRDGADLALPPFGEG